MQRTQWDNDTAKIVAKILLDIEAVNIRADEPYTLTSGWKSPVYVDCRKIIYFPRARQKIIELAAEQIGRHFGFETIQAVAGGETAGIPYAAWLSDKLLTPMAYIRKKPKGFGRNAQIEGAVPEGLTTLLVEDLTTDGGSKVAFAKVLRDAGAICRHAFVVFYYGVFPGAAETMRDLGLDLLHLCQWEDVLTVCEEEGGRFPPQALQTARQFLADPMAWSAARGGVGSAEEAAAYKAAKG